MRQTIKSNAGFGGVPLMLFVVITFIPSLFPNMSLITLPLLSLVAILSLLFGIIFIKTQTISSKILLATTGLLILFIWGVSL